MRLTVLKINNGLRHISAQRKVQTDTNDWSGRRSPSAVFAPTTAQVALYNKKERKLHPCADFALKNNLVIDENGWIFTDNDNK